MGAFDLGFMQGSQAGAGDLARSRQLQDEQRQQNLQRNWSILNDPAATDDLKAQAGQDIQNQYPTPDHRGTFLSDILHIHGHKQAAQNAQGNTTPPPAAQPATPTQQPAAVDQLGVPYSSAPASPPPAAASPAAPAKPPLAAVAGASTPQDAMNLWRQYRGPQQIQTDLEMQRGKAAAGYAQTLADKNNAARIMEAQIRAHGNVSMQKMDAAAQSLGAEDFASATPEIKMQAMKAMASANRAPAWKSVTDGNSIYAVNSLDPTQRTLLGHKDDLTQRQEFRTMTNPDGSTFLVPVTVWSKKGSSTPVMETQDDQGGAPVSASTPQGPGGASQYPAGSAPPSGTSASPSAPPQGGAPVSSTTPQGPGSALAAVNASIQSGNATSKKLNKGKPAPSIPAPSVGAPIPMGGKPSELAKSDTSQYTKLAEDANAKQEALGLAQQAARSPSPSSDQQLIYAWVRANVQGAGRMTQQEFNQAARIGSLPQKVDNWWSMASTGKMTPEIRQMLLTDIRGAATNAQTMADTARSQVQQDIGQKPTSSKTPKAPGAWTAPKDAPAPVRPNQVLKANGQIIARSIDGKTWSQP